MEKENISLKRAEYDKKYEAVIAQIVSMPKETADEKAARWVAFRNALGAEDFGSFLSDTFDVMEIRNPINVSERKDTDNNAGYLFEKIAETIQSFSGDPLEYRPYLATSFNRVRQKSGTRELTEDRLPMIENKKKTSAEVKKTSHLLMKKLYSWFDNETYRLTEEEFLTHGKSILEEIMKTSEETQYLDAMSEEERMQHLKEVFYLNNGSIQMYSMEDALNDDGMTISDTIQDEHALEAYASLENAQVFTLLINRLHEAFEEDIPDLRTKNIIRMFLTQDMLKELKLNSNGKPYQEEPAGNKDVYDLLLPSEKMLLGDSKQLFYQDYLDYIFNKSPEKLLSVYAWIMKEGIKLKDTDLADCEGMQRGTISKKRTRYEEIMKNMRNLVG